jgi:tetratricopeptide (TPR) repeat protein
MTLQERLESYIKNPEDLDNCFRLGYEYEKIGQQTSAITFYLKCSERTEDDNFAYECLLRMAKCYNDQGGRSAHAISNARWAVSLLPNRPEAYHMLSIYYERRDCWKESMMYARIGVECTESGSFIIPINIEKYMLKFQYAHTIYWCGRFKESYDLFVELLNSENMSHKYVNLVRNNIKNLANVE